MGGAPDPKQAWERVGSVRERVGEGRNSPYSNSAPHGLSTASCDNKDNGDVVPHISVVVSGIGAAPTNSAVQFRGVSVGIGGVCGNSTTMTPLALLSLWGALPVVVIVFRVMRP